MASPREDICPTCRVVFSAGERYSESGRGSGKTCPNGHYNSMGAIRAMRVPPIDSASIIKALEARTGFGYEGWSENVPENDLVAAFRDALRRPEVGDRVRPRLGVFLRSGSEAYGGAICVSVNPFVLVSAQGDMRWEATIRIEDFIPVGKAPEAQMSVALRRKEE